MTNTTHAPDVATVENLLLKHLEEGKMELPLLPEVAMQVTKLTSSPDANAKDLADLIRRDQALAAHLLRVANSAIYARGVAIESLQVALSRLGMTRIREIVLAISCQSRVFSCKGHEDEVRSVFRHSLATAMFSGEIARVMRKNVDDAFVLGLLHDVGHPVVLQAIIDLSTESHWTIEDGTHIQVVKDLHESVGSAMIKRWGLSDRIADTIRGHHEDWANRRVEEQMPFALLNLADELAIWAIERPDDKGVDFQRHAALGVLNLYPDDVETLLKQREKVLATVESFG